MSQQAPVCDLDAEAAVLSALLLDPQRISSIDTILSPRDFYSPENRVIAEVIWALDAEAAAIDITAVASQLKAIDRFDAIGAGAYLGNLLDATPAVAHVADHARIVASAARIRHVQAVCQTAKAEGYSALPDAVAWLESVQRRMYEATDNGLTEDTIALLSQAVPDEYDAIVARSKGEAEYGRPTRIPALDRILNTLVDGVPYILAGRPGHGKTALAWQIAEGVAKGGELVAFLSQEMPKAQLTMRAIAQAASIEPQKLLSGDISDDEWPLIAQALGHVSRLPVAIDERSGHSVQSARGSVRRCVNKLRGAGNRGRLGLIVLDYLQIMSRPSRVDPYQGATDNMRGLTQMAKEFRCPVLVLSQLNRSIEKRQDKRPMLSDLADTGAIEADGYGVMFVYREDCYRDEAQHDGLAEIIVAKQRNGRIGTAKLRYLPSTQFAAPADEWDGDFQDGTGE